MFLVEPNSFSEAQTAPADGNCFSAQNGKNGTGVAVVYCHPNGIRFPASWLETKDFGMEAAPDGPFLLSRSCYARRLPVVVLQDGTVGTFMVPKQT